MYKKYNIQGEHFLRVNHAGAMILKDGRTVNYGVIRINDDNEVVYYTGKGLREIWQPNKDSDAEFRATRLKRLMHSPMGEQELIDAGYIATTPLSEILRVMF